MKHTLTLFTALLLVIYQGGNHAIAGIWDKGTDRPGVNEPASRLRLRFDADWRFRIDDATPSNPSEGKQGTRVEGWKWQMTDRRGAASGQLANPELDLSGTNWQDRVQHRDIFGGKPGFAWFRAILPQVPKPGSDQILVLHFEGVDDNGTVYLKRKKADVS